MAEEYHLLAIDDPRTLLSGVPLEGTLLSKHDSIPEALDRWVNEHGADRHCVITDAEHKLTWATLGLIGAHIPEGASEPDDPGGRFHMAALTEDGQPVSAGLLTPSLGPEAATLLAEGRRRLSERTRQEVQQAQNDEAEAEHARRLHWSALMDFALQDIPRPLWEFANLAVIAEHFHGPSADQRPTTDFMLEVTLPGGVPVRRRYIAERISGPSGGEDSWTWQHARSEPGGAWGVVAYVAGWADDESGDRAVEEQARHAWGWYDDLLIALADAQDGFQERLRLERKVADSNARKVERQSVTQMAPSPKEQLTDALTAFVESIIPPHVYHEE